MYKDNRNCHYYFVTIYHTPQGWKLEAESLKYFNDIFREKVYKTAESAEKALHRFNRKLSDRIGAGVYSVYGILG